MMLLPRPHRKSQRRSARQTGRLAIPIPKIMRLSWSAPAEREPSIDSCLRLGILSGLSFQWMLPVSWFVRRQDEGEY